MLLNLEPFASKENLRHMLLTLKEDKELDSLIGEYIRTCLMQRVIMSPSKGRYGEKGKDIVAIENEITNDYCSYIIKRGALQKNLDGPHGILVQISDAMLIELEIDQYKGKKRTAVVVHNGNEGYRGAIDRFGRTCREIEEKLSHNLLLRSIERWDIEILVGKLWDYRNILKNNAETECIYNQWAESQSLMLDFKKGYEAVGTLDDTAQHKASLADKLYQGILKAGYKYGTLLKGKGKKK